VPGDWVLFLDGLLGETAVPEWLSPLMAVAPGRRLAKNTENVQSF
jgi:hypothetical protein